MAQVPSSKPQITREKLIEKINQQYPAFVLPDFFTCGIRGYYEDTMGKKDANDRLMYDDAMFIVGKNEMFSFNANVDPGAFRKGIANLKPGVYLNAYKFDLHSGKYLAICQRSAPVTVIRDGIGEDTGMFGINQHKGGFRSVSSLGCQTIYPTQWDGKDGFITKAQEIALKYYGKNYKSLSYTYVLMIN